VAGKLEAAQRQIVELMTLSAELQRAAETLELHRPDGACDDRCGRVAEAPVSGPRTQPVSLVTKGVTTVLPEIACTLSPESMGGRLDQWRALLAHVTRRESLDRGVRAVFGAATPLDELIRLTAAEQDCCRFFDFAITIDGRGIALEVRAPDAALPIVQSLFGDAA
jgi:MerR family transcriptional regulator, copper efflux regulator